MIGTVSPRSVPHSGSGPRRGPRPASGAWLGKHQLIHQIAVGGMAEIYLARATGIEQFEKLLVLKRMLPQYAADHRFIRMFLDEARLAATLSHPNIAHVYDIGCGDGQYYFTMEYVHGEDLASVLHASRSAGRPIPLEHVLTVITGVAAGLHAAHEKRGADGALLGVVHRDVSPSNILVGYDGSVKVVDFGIARVAAQHGTTRAGGFMGKARYASPEHLQGEPLDRRSDLFSLGILLYELTTGKRPFDGDSDFAVMQEIVNGDAPAPGRVCPGYPAALENIVVRALQRDRDARFATAQALQLALEELARQQRLSLSSVMLSTYMAELFGEKLAAWHQARRAGRSLSDHVIATITGGTEDLEPPAPAAVVSALAPAAPAELPAPTELAPPAHTAAAHVGAASRNARRTWQRLGISVGLLGAAVGVAQVVSSMRDASPSAVEVRAMAPAPASGPDAPDSRRVAPSAVHGVSDSQRVAPGAVGGGPDSLSVAAPSAVGDTPGAQPVTAPSAVDGVIAPVAPGSKRRRDGSDRVLTGAPGGAPRAHDGVAPEVSDAAPLSSGVSSVPRAPQDPPPSQGAGTARPARTRGAGGQRGNAIRPRIHRARPSIDGAAQRAQPSPSRRNEENPRAWDPDSPLEP